MKFVKMIDPIGKAYIHLDLEGLKMPSMNFDYEPFLNFHTDTYFVLRASMSEFAWNVVYGDVNVIINKFTEEEQILFVSLLISMHYQIMETLKPGIPIEGPKLIQLETELSKTLLEFDQKVNLIPKLIEYVEQHIEIMSFAGVGERAQDTVEMTFYRDDVVKLTAQALLCKMMSPVFGVFIESCKKRIDNTLKELHCNAILKDVLLTRLPDLTLKLNNFITRIMKPSMGRAKLTQIFNGYTYAFSTQINASNINTRRLVAVDLHKPNGNLITYVTACVRSAAQTQSTSSGGKNAVSPLLTSKTKASDDDGNVSILEAETRSSSKTADFQIKIELAVRQLISSFTIEHELDPAKLDEARNYYEVNHLVLQPINSYLLSILFGSALGGARSIESLDSKMLSALVPMAQLFFIQQGYPELVPVVSLTPTMQLKAYLTGADTQLAAMWNNSYEYRNCDSHFTLTCNEIRWDTSLSKIVEFVTKEINLYNTAPSVIEMMKEENHNGEPYQTSENLSRAICSLITQTELAEYADVS